MQVAQFSHGYPKYLPTLHETSDGLPQAQAALNPGTPTIPRTTSYRDETSPKLKPR